MCCKYTVYIYSSGLRRCDYVLRGIDCVVCMGACIYRCAHICSMLIPALYKKRKHLDENDDCASARLVRMVKYVKKLICDRY